MSNSKEMVEITCTVHIGNILSLLMAEVTGKLTDEDYQNAERIIKDYILRYFKDSEMVSGSQLESFQDYCSRVKEEQPNAPWEDETVESMYKMYKQEKTGL